MVPTSPIAVATAVLSTAVGDPAPAIRRIAGKSVVPGRSATIRPSVGGVTNVKVESKRLTVVKGSTAVAKNRASVKLKAGTYRVTTIVKYRIRTGSTATWSKVLTKKSSQKLTVRTKRSTSATGGNRPAWAPIKGNNNSMIYHVPGGRSYSRTKVNVTCFSAEKYARAEGFRKAKN